jgi:hypothetical protein
MLPKALPKMAAISGCGGLTLGLQLAGFAALKLDCVLVAWDGGRAATRAIGDAMPVLEKANKWKNRGRWQ